MFVATELGLAATNTPAALVTTYGKKRGRDGIERTPPGTMETQGGLLFTFCCKKPCTVHFWRRFPTDTGRSYRLPWRRDRHAHFVRLRGQGHKRGRAVLGPAAPTEGVGLLPGPSLSPHGRLPDTNTLQHGVALGFQAPSPRLPTSPRGKRVYRHCRLWQSAQRLASLACANGWNASRATITSPTFSRASVK